VAVAERTKDDKDLPTLASELWDLVVRYAKQEALDPILALRRYLMWGVIGSVLLAVGVPMVLLGGLRAAQDELSPGLTGNLSWVPYVIVLGGSAVIMALLVRGIGADKRRAERRRAALTKQGLMKQGG
jgi:hypothetical protein